ncbi:phosphatase PAP2 family protein [Hymenobacter sp. DH14]|uniref:Phosphatase PAP2 family protein n=1 Tax=Hymenobacter cyanobacteriorum TaxID=2926463 RepID=A0A9X1VMB9_9BACT|nr:phosphatase PAP2 family protein [Hymenobacter cyanobacteriorum]MCI1189665.1 phosphatase PAP2 family protein [Hymenobacter cyanobacteriorum]
MPRFARFSDIARHLLARHRRLLGVVLFGVLLPWGIFLKVGSEIREQEGFAGDTAALRLVHAHATPTLDAVNLALTRAGGPPVMAVLCGLIAAGLWWRWQHRRAAFFGAAVGGAAALNLLAKGLLGRPRPALWASLAPETSSGFPSGHAMGTAALVLAVGLLAVGLLAPWRGRWLAWTLGGLFVLGVGFSRVYLGVHYPSDVLSGWIASVGWVSSVYVLFSPALREWWGSARLRQQSHRHQQHHSQA